MYDNDKDKENQNPLDDLDGGLKKAKNTAHKVTDLTDNAKKAQQMLNNYKAGKAKKATSDVQKTNKVESGTTGKIKSAFNKFMGKKAKPIAPVNNLAKKRLKYFLHTTFAPILLPLLLLFVVVALIASIFMFTTPSSMGEAYTTEIGIDDSDGEDNKTSKAIEDLDDSSSSSDLSIGSLIKGLFKKIVMTVKEYFGHWNDLSGGDDVNADDEDIFSQTYYKDARRNKKVMVKHLKRCRSNLYDYVYRLFNSGKIHYTIVMPSYEEVYGKSNLGDLMIILNMGLFGYDDNGEKKEFDVAKLKKYLRSHESYGAANNFFYFSSWDVVGTTVYVHMDPYTVNSLYSLFGMNGATPSSAGTFNSSVDITKLDKNTKEQIETAVQTAPTKMKGAIYAGLSLVGKIQYQWGGKYYEVGMDPKWGTVVTSGNDKGKVKGLDCSGFVTWCLINGGFEKSKVIEHGSGGTGSLNSLKYTTNVKAGTLKIGDLGFKRTGGSSAHSNANHVGIYMGKGYWMHCNSTANTVSVDKYKGFRIYRRIKYNPIRIVNSSDFEFYSQNTNTNTDKNKNKNKDKDKGKNKNKDKNKDEVTVTESVDSANSEKSSDPTFASPQSSETIYHDEITVEMQRQNELTQLKAILEGTNIDLGLENETPLSTAEDIFGLDGYISGTGKVSTSKTTKLVYQALKKLGCTDEGIAGAMGNIQAEHGFHTDGDGLIQWTGGRKQKLIAFAKKHGLPYTDANVQVQYLCYELRTVPQYNKVLKAMKDPKNDVIFCCDIFCDLVEGCQTLESFTSKGQNPPHDRNRYVQSTYSGLHRIDLGKRRDNADAAYKQIKKGKYND